MKKKPPATPDRQPAAAHGFRPDAFNVIRWEDIDEIKNIKAELVEFYKPTNGVELFAVERLAVAQNNLLRGERFEAGAFGVALDDNFDGKQPLIFLTDELAGLGDIEISRHQNRNNLTAQGVRKFAGDGNNVLTLAIRYKVVAERLYRRAVEDLERILAYRGKPPAEPGPQPKRPEPTGPPAKLSDNNLPREYERVARFWPQASDDEAAPYQPPPRCEPCHEVTGHLDGSDFNWDGPPNQPCGPVYKRYLFKEHVFARHQKACEEAKASGTRPPPFPFSKRPI